MQILQVARRSFTLARRLSTTASRGPEILSADSCSFDAERDVVVVGSGAAGSMAALSAAWGGAEVELLEKDKKTFGGTTAKSGGTFWIPNNPLMREQGMNDPRDAALRMLAAMGFPDQYKPGAERLGLDGPEYAWLEQYYDVGPQMCEELQARGVCTLEMPQFLPDGQAAGALVLDYTAHPENAAPTGRMLGSGMPGVQKKAISALRGLFTAMEGPIRGLGKRVPGIKETLMLRECAGLLGGRTGRAGSDWTSRMELVSPCVGT